MLPYWRHQLRQQTALRASYPIISYITAKLYHFCKLASSKENAAACSYRNTLDSSDRVRYDAKLGLIGNEDLYAFERSDWTDDVMLLTSITYIDIMNYLVFSQSPYTMEDLRGYTQLDAYNQFVSGWVREKWGCMKEDYCVVTAKVSV